ncbi:MAG TPA: glycosyltransferase 87 family protein [Terriglobales bacterium]|nr:glycosyltransferase 87 family protein [Terriglobales bacterium]
MRYRGELKVTGPVSARYFSLAPIFILLLAMGSYYGHLRKLTQQRLDSLGFPARNFSDTLPRWIGTRELLLHGADPYSLEVTREIQRAYYGRALDSQRPADPIDEQRFAYPLFVVFVFAPFISLPFHTFQLTFALVLCLASALTVIIWMRAIHLPLSPDKVLALILAAFTTIPYVEGIQLQQLSLLVAFFLAAAVFAILKNNLLVAGALLALATIKPQLSIALAGCLLLWSISQWPSRKRLLIGFVLTLSALVLASEFLLPRWPLQFLGGLSAYLRYTQARTGIHALLGDLGGTAALIFLTAIAAAAVWRAKSAPLDSEAFGLALCFALTLTCCTVPSLAAHNQVLLLPGYLLLAKEHKRLRSSGRLARALLLAAALTILWPWLTGCLLLALRPIQSVADRFWDIPLALGPLTPVIIFAALTPLSFRENLVQ